MATEEKRLGLTLGVCHSLTLGVTWRSPGIDGAHSADINSRTFSLAEVAPTMSTHCEGTGVRRCSGAPAGQSHAWVALTTPFVA